MRHQKDVVIVYNSTPMGSLAAGAGGAAAASPWMGMQALWIGLATFTLVSACLAVKRILPKRTS